MQARMGRRGGPDEGDSGDGSGCGDGRDDAGGATHPSAAINDVIVQSHALGSPRLSRRGPRHGPIAVTATENGSSALPTGIVTAPSPSVWRSRRAPRAA